MTEETKMTSTLELSAQLLRLIKENNESKFDQLLEHINLADEHITFAQRLYRQGALTEEERKSNEGVHFGSSLYYLITHSPKVEQALELIKIFRDPEGNKGFIDALNAAAKKEGAENFDGSLMPPEIFKLLKEDN